MQELHVHGTLGAAQRGYYSGPLGYCSKFGMIAVTVLAGPLNYVGVSPKLTCTMPQPTE